MKFTKQHRSDNLVKQWLVDFFTTAIEKTATKEDRLEILAWLTLVRETLRDTDLSYVQKIKKIEKLSDGKKTIQIILRSLALIIDNYKKSDMPLAVKVALPITLATATFFGGAGVGIAGFGGAVGVPLLLLVFIGVAGITAILESFFDSEDAQSYIGVVLSMIVQDEIYRQANKSMQQAMTSSPLAPRQQSLSKDTASLTQELQTMDAFLFEQHIMSFFQQAGFIAWVTKKSNDFGVDGFVKHSQGLIVVQCKRYKADNVVGRPVVQQFKGVIEENNAYHGYLVTSGYFSKDAKNSALLNDKLVLIDIDDLIDWHKNGLKI